MNVSDEQTMLNYALKHFGVVWMQNTSKHVICSVKNGLWSKNDPIKVYALPQGQFCRLCCNQKSMNDLYNVHPIISKLHPKLKASGLKKMHSWFLKTNWEDSVESDLIGDEWLSIISVIDSV